MRTLLLILAFVVSCCINASAQDNVEIHNRAKEWQKRMNNVKNEEAKDELPNRNPRFSEPHFRPPHHNNFGHRPHGNPYNGFRPPVGYFPVVQWYPTGTWMNVGPVFVSPDRRYVRFGINAGFSEYRGFDTFNFYNGQTRNYGRR